MYIPKVRERVKVDGWLGFSLVLSIDLENQRANIVSLANSAFLEDDVSFAAIRPIWAGCVVQQGGGGNGPN